MRRSGRIQIKGIVQGVGFRPFVYATARRLGIRGFVKNLGSEVEIQAAGEQFEAFLEAVSRGPPLSRIDRVEVLPDPGPFPDGFSIQPSGSGSLSGMIPPDIATCDQCLADISTSGGRYMGYWCTSCVNCGPRYSIIRELPYDRERTSMDAFPMCPECAGEYLDPECRRHHAQTIACASCGPRLRLLDREGKDVSSGDIIAETARILDAGYIVAIRGIGGFHLACIEDSAGDLKRRLGRSEQPFAVMVRPDSIDRIATLTAEDRMILESCQRPIVILVKRDPDAHLDISNLHTIGCMLPYTGLHHLLFSHLSHSLLILTSANMPGYPMITEIDVAMARMHEHVDFFLTHDRRILNRCDDSVVRDGYIIRLSRGLAPRRTPLDLGNCSILAVGPELNANVTIYRDGFCTTSPHVGNVRNPQTYAYLQETITKLGRLLGEGYQYIAHDAHPQFLSTRYARELADQHDAMLVPVQHHQAHIAATTMEPCIGIAIDGVGYGQDGTIWGGEIFAGSIPRYDRVGHLEVVPMPGGDLATRFPERMLYGILPDPSIADLIASRGWTDVEVSVLEAQLSHGINVVSTSSTGRVLDAAAALLGICRERTYDGEPAMKLEAFAVGGKAETWDLEYIRLGGREVLSTRSLLRKAMDQMERVKDHDQRLMRKIAASFQFNLARGIAGMAIHAAFERDIPIVALSGGVAYNRAIRETIRNQVTASGLELRMNPDFPLGDGCISYGQCIYAAVHARDE
ncbi:MAG: carbamoyltransferase HypF [Methanolinea sp.]|jgi:hydrogenase maturation protein HypF|nr:carbamoyltransferase HypF [Methanolinea sp.]